MTVLRICLLYTLQAVLRSMGRTLLLSGLILIAACEPEKPPPVEDQSIRSARVFLVSEQGATDRREFVGRVGAAQTVDMSFQVSGPLEKLPVREGQTIAAGELVASLDTTDYELAVKESKVQLKLAYQDWHRKEKLLKERGVSLAVVDDAKATYELRQIRSEQALEALSDTRIMAPFDAYVARRFTDNYINVQAGDKIVRLNDLSELFVLVDVPETMLATVSPDSVSSILVRFPFAPGQSFPLQFRENTGEANAVAQTYRVTFSMVPPESLNVLPGMTAQVEILMSTDQAIEIKIPVASLVVSPDKQFYVWVVDDRTGKVTKRFIDIGPALDSGISVLSGLRAGDMIVVSGASQLQTGMSIRIHGDPMTEL
jgi:RND family efflux transporter MFP subunit